MQNLIFKGLNGEFKIAAATQYITRIKDSTNKVYISLCLENMFISFASKLFCFFFLQKYSYNFDFIAITF